MTMLDKLAEFADNASIAMTAGSTALVLTNQIDLSAASLNVGGGEPIYLVVSVGGTAVQAAGAGTIEIQLVSDDSASISTATAATSVTYHARSAPITTANNTTSNPKGKVLFACALPMRGASGTGTSAYERYLGVRVVATTQDISGGTVDAYLTMDPQSYFAYANAI